MAELGEPRIRQAREDDIPAAMELFAELGRFQREWRVFELKPTVAAEAEARYRSGLGADPDAVLLVAEQGGRLLGMAFAHVLVPSSMSNERGAELSNVVVRPEARRRGVGRALVREVGRWAAGRGARRVVIKTYWQNEDALRFWTELGFRPRYLQLTATVEELDASGS